MAKQSGFCDSDAIHVQGCDMVQYVADQISAGYGYKKGYFDAFYTG